jgi:tetratricopeptide (TPR) repeat protein
MLGSPHCLDEQFICRMLDGELSGDERRSAESHLDACESCRELVAEVARKNESTVGSDADVEPRFAPPAPLARGAEVGRYLVLETIGGGGMGIVYAAYDPKLDRRVALKLLRGDLALSSVASDRLSREAQAMARLSHPNVITVHDVGAIGDQVFVAMELVEGETLTDWLRYERRSVPEILAAFRMAGAGLAAAHAAGIIHRDFKPDNVLIGKDGRIRVTDFGLARTDLAAELPLDLRVSTPSEGVRLHRLTQRGHVMGTPAYMSPEQADGGTIDARSDLFSFCVALYEALYRERPFAGRTLQELREAARAGAVREPPRGSKVPLWVRRILLRGLANDPAQRYPSMAALLAALARDPARLRRRGIWGGALFFAAAGATALIVWAMEARARTCSGAERKLAGAWDEARKREVQAAFLGTGRPFAPDTWRASERALDEYVRRWVSMHTEACEATRVHGDQSEELLDLRVQCLMVRRSELAKLTAVFAKGDARVVESAVKAVHRLTPVDGCADVAALRFGAPPPADEETRARVEEARARLDTAKALVNAGKPREALEPAVTGLALAERSGVASIIAEALYRLGVVKNEVGDFRGADEGLSAAYWRAVSSRSDELATRAAIRLILVEGESQRDRWAEDARALLVRIGRNPRLEALFATSCGVRERLNGRSDKAILNHQRALDLLEAAGQPDDLLRADCLRQMAVTQISLAQYEGAIARLRDALAIVEANLGKMHPQHANVLAELLRPLRAVGRYSDALDAARRALAIREQALGPTHLDTARSMTDVALGLGDLARFDEALPMLRRAISITQRRLGDDRDEVNRMRYLLGLLTIYMGRYEEAIAILQHVLAAREGVVGPKHPVLLWTRLGLAGALLGAGRYAEALSSLESASGLRRAQSTANEHVDMMFAMRRGEAEVGLGRYGEALQSYQRALAISRHLFGASHIRVAQALLGMGEAMVGLGRFGEATPMLEQAMGLLTRADGWRWVVARAQFALARSLLGAKKDRRRALALASEARARWKRLVPADRVFLGRIDAWLDRVKR